MQKKNIHVYPLNRVEGDLKIGLEIEGGVVTEAWSAGTMYRGFENILVGRGPLDGLVITPRICGICSTSHLYAAAKALDMVTGVRVPDDAIRIRNGTLMVEKIQNDVRHSFLLFMADFARPFYRGHPLYDEAVERYQPLKGRTALQTVQQTKKILEIVAILGGQWPHSSFMVPGGVVSLPSRNEIMQCRYILANFRKWYEEKVLGGPIDHFRKIATCDELDAWLDESATRYDSELGFFIRMCRESGLNKIGRGHGAFLSYGAFDMPENTDQKSIDGGPLLFPAGVTALDDTVTHFHQDQIAEDISHSWFDGYTGDRHPFEGLTQPYATGSESDKYSWCKAPRYDGRPLETGPLAQLFVARLPLVVDLMEKDGPSAYTRQLARLIRPALYLPVLDQWLQEICCDRKHFFNNYKKIQNGQGYGLVQAPRGGLGHWVTIQDGKIDKYQIITPSAWNASPRDENGVRGPWEEALLGTTVKDAGNPVEIDHILRSFDPCLVCTVHAVSSHTRQKTWSVY